METRKMKQSALSKVSGVARASISSYLTGRYKANSVQTYKLAKALGVDPLWLMGMDTEMESREPSIKESIVMMIDSYSEEQLEKLLKFLEGGFI